MKTRFTIDPKHISHERLQDEAIIINLPKGAYFSGTGPAADLWTLISGGATVEEASKLLAAAYKEDEDVVRAGVGICVSHLVEQNVLSEGPQASPVSGAPTLPDLPRGAWTSPSFDEYTDMWDLLKFDPIHDVDETGWPYATPIARV